MTVQIADALKRTKIDYLAEADGEYVAKVKENYEPQNPVTSTDSSVTIIGLIQE